MSSVKTLVLLNNETLAEHSNLARSENLHVPKSSSYKIIHVMTEAQVLDWQITVAAEAKYEHWLINLSKAPVNYNVVINLQAKAAEAKFKGIILGQNKAELKHKLRLEHHADHTHTDILVHALADDQSKINFDGMIYVKEKIKGVDAKELLKNLLLSNQAEINVKPILEIYSNDIACSHGASIGDLDEAALFYLKSRGFSAEEAKATLLKSFTTEFLPQLENIALQNWLEQLILTKLKKDAA